MWLGASSENLLAPLVPGLVLPILESLGAVLLVVGCYYETIAIQAIYAVYNVDNRLTS